MMNCWRKESEIESDVKCNLCGCNRFRTIEDDQQPFKVLMCRYCSLVFVHPHPAPAALKEHYDQDYYREWLDKQRIKRLGMWQRRLQKITKRRRPGKLLDVGCGEGTFLSVARKAGWKVSGTEISAFAAKHASAALKTDIFCGDLRDAGFPRKSFDVVTLWHVLEHVDNPRHYLAEVHRIIKPDGLFVIAVPNVNNLILQYAYRLIKHRKLKFFVKGEKEIHLYHFSPVTLRRYLEETGFSCLRLAPDYGIIEPAKRIVNWISVMPYYLGGIQIFNAIEVFAVPKKEAALPRETAP